MSLYLRLHSVNRIPPLVFKEPVEQSLCPVYHNGSLLQENASLLLYKQELDVLKVHYSAFFIAHLKPTDTASTYRSRLQCCANIKWMKKLTRMVENCCLSSKRVWACCWWPLRDVWRTKENNTTNMSYMALEEFNNVKSTYGIQFMLAQHCKRDL